MGHCCVRRAGVGLQATPHKSKRRSTRPSCRPLEWWRNEHKIYERKFRSVCPVGTPASWQPCGACGTLCRYCSMTCMDLLCSKSDMHGLSLCSPTIWA